MSPASRVRRGHEPVVSPSRRHRSRGQALVELALVTPILLLLFAGAADLGRAFYGYIAIENAAKEGVLYGARYPLCATSSTLCPDPDNVLWRFRQEIGPNLRNPDGTAPTPTTTCAAPNGTARSDLRQCVPGDTYRVAATYTFAPITPMLSSILGGDLTVATSSSAIVMNMAFDPTPGIAPVKLVRGTNARNASELASKCTQPDPTGSAGFYRSPCKDTANNDVFATFRTGDPITYKLTVRNNGGTNLSGVTITDSLGWPASCPVRPTTLAVGATPYTCTYSRTAPTPPGGGAAGAYPNTLTADSAETVPATDVASVRVELPPADLRVLKWVSPYRDGDDGDGVPSFGSLSSVPLTRSAQIPQPSAWFQIIVTNIGGQTATGVTITDSRGVLPYGQNNSTALCDAQPTSIVAGGQFTCRYRVVFSANGTIPNTVTAASPDDTATGNNSATATVVVSSCTGTNRTVPNLIGIVKTAVASTWTAAGFTGSVTTWSGQNSATVVTQNRTAFSCIASNSTVTVTRTSTP